MKLASFIQSVALLAAVAATPSCSKSEIGADDARLEPVKSPCPTTGSPMVKLTTPSGWSFCIDKTAVKQKDYEVWVQKTEGRGPSPITIKEPENCVGIAALPAARKSDDELVYHTCEKSHYTPAETPDAPVVCVGVCQARAYCKFVGKRLCARIGGGVLPMPEVVTENGLSKQVVDGPEASADSELYFACSQGGKTRFAWGDTKPAPAERCGAEGCSGEASPFDQIFGMSDGPSSPEERCYLKGASCYYPASHNNGVDPELRDGACDYATGAQVGPETGIRCCADPL